MIVIPGYRIEEEIARGGMGVVYRARNEASGDPVAIKVLSGKARSVEDVERFRREARVLAALDHPGILHARDFGIADASPYLVTDLVPGEPLDERVAAQGPLDEAAARHIGARLADALAHAHERGVLHRDLKPSNVILTPAGDPVLVDFGVAKRTRSASERLTRTGAILGTPVYMAPEQAMSATDVGPKADLYGLGAILFFLLSGEPPFSTKGGALQVMTRISTQEAKNLRSLRPSLSLEFAGVVARCLAKDPAERYADGAALRDALKTPATRREPSPLKRIAALLALGACGFSLAALLTKTSVRAFSTQPPAQVERVVGLDALFGEPQPFDRAALRASVAPLASSREPARPAAMLELGVRLALLEDYPTALQVFSRALHHKPGDTRALLLAARGQVHALSAAWPLAVVDLRDAVAAPPESSASLQTQPWLAARDRAWGSLVDRDGASRAHEQVGQVLAESGRHAEAIAEFDLAFATDLSRASLFAARGRSRHALSLLEGAAGDFEQAIRLANKVSEYFAAKARVHEDQGNLVLAKTAYERAIKRSPKDPELYFALGALQLDKANPDQITAFHNLNLALKHGLSGPSLTEAERLLKELKQAMGQ